MRTPAALVLLCVLVPVLAGCGRGAGRPGGPQGPLRPSAALNAGGEPQWSAQVRAGVLRFTAGDGPPLALKAEREDRGRAGVVWRGVSPAAANRPGVPLRLSVTPKPCQDATTGLSYPLSATVEVGGGRYAGCAAPAGQGLGPRT